MEREPSVTVGSLSQAIKRVVSESQASRDSGNTDWYEICTLYE
jgi:hypothetical protein